MRDYPHGGDSFSFMERFGKKPTDFSVSVNPVPLPESVKKAYISAFETANIYPDFRADKLREKISKFEAVGKDCIICANGASDIIYKLFCALKPKTAVMAVPVFDDYSKAAAIAGTSLKFHYLKSENGFRLTEDFLNRIEENSLCVVCNPNNPTGLLTGAEMADKIAQKCADMGATLVADECFIDFCPGAASFKKYMKDNGNLLIIKAFTKVFGMAGLRLGYGLSSNMELLEKIDSAGQSWNISAPAMACGEAVLEDFDYLKKSLEIINAEKSFILSVLEKLNVKICGHDANFIFFRCKEHNLSEKLQKYGIMIRDCSNFEGLDRGYYRIGIRLHVDNEKLTEALKNEIPS